MRQPWVQLARSLFVVVVASTFVLPADARAEEQPETFGSISVGSRVRLQAPTAIQGPIQGSVMEVDREYVLVSTENQGSLRVSRRAITQLEMSSGRRGYAKKGAIIGGAIGAVLAVAVLAIPEEDWCTPSDSACATTKGPYALAAAIGGVGSGTLIGHLIKRDVWSPVPLEGVRVSLAPTRARGVRGTLSFSW